jgi:hypothetical protein
METAHKHGMLMHADENGISEKGESLSLGRSQQIARVLPLFAPDS